MNQLTEFLVNSILAEEKNEIIGIYGGGFKPPIKGHLEVLQGALDKYPEMDEVIVSVGSGVRDEIDQEESLLVWDIYQKYLPMKVNIGASKTQPIRDIYKLAKENPDKTIYWIIGAREGREDDLQDIAKRTAAIDKAEDKYSNVEVKVIQTKDPKVSGTNARKALLAGNKEEFFTYLPDNLTDEEKEEIFTIVRPAVKEQLKEHSMGSSIDLLPYLAKLTQHMIDKGYNIEPLPGLELIDDDFENAEDFFGKTAYYDPVGQIIVLYTHGRHPKDIARSYAHEMIHHIQNLEGRLGNITTTNTQEDDHLNDIEAEANLKGTMTFRNWTDSLNEIGDASQKPYSWNRKVSEDPDDGLIEGVDYRFTTDLDTNYVAFFQMVGPMEYEFGFNIPGGNQAQVSNKGELYRVMATMVAIMKDFMDLMGNDWSEIAFSGSKDPSRREDNRRDKLYMAYIKKHLPSSVQVDHDDAYDMTVLRNTLAESLNEIGDASAGAFPYNQNRIDTIVDTLKDKIDNQPDAKWRQHLLPFLKFSSPNADYEVITTAQVDKPLNIPDFQTRPNLIELRVDFMVGESDEATNIGEQYKVMATMTQIIKALMDKVSKIEGSKLQSVKLFAKSDGEEDESDINSKRGKLYQAFVKKNLPQGWKMSTDKNAWGSYIALSPELKEGFDKKLGKDPFGLNAFAYELARLDEGAYDSLVNRLTKQTINQWKKDLAKRNPKSKAKSKSFIDLDIDEVDAKGREIEFNFLGLTEFNPKIDGYVVNGTSNSGEEKNKIPFVATLFEINPKILPQAWSKIYMDVADVIRHEIEHLTQAGPNLRSDKYMEDDIDIRDMINKLKVLPKKNYYLLQKEVDAMLQGLYFKAKKSKKPFADVVDNYLNVAPGIDTKEDKEMILNLWRSRRKALSLPVFENEEKVMDYKIFLDMDGVLVNFDQQFKELTGMMPREFESKYSSDKFWEEIDGAGVGFWRGMKWMPGGEALYNRASQFDHALLSSPSRSEVSKIGKRLWRRDKTPDTKLILARSYNKRKYAAPNHILIDDREDNIQQWIDAGGIGILYKSADQVNAELDKLGL